MTILTSRRSLLTGGAAAIATSAVCIASAPDSIEYHWQARRQAFQEFEADALVLDDAVTAQNYWDRVDAAEMAILNSPDTSPRATEIRLWVAWWHTDVTHREAVSQGAVAALLPIRNDLDWEEKLIFAAILNLRGENL